MYVPSSNAGWFYPPYNGQLKALSLSNMETQVREIDHQSAYAYLGETGKQINCIAYERPEVLAEGETRVNILTAEFSVRRIPLRVLLQQLTVVGGRSALNP